MSSSSLVVRRRPGRRQGCQTRFLSDYNRIESDQNTNSLQRCQNYQDDIDVSKIEISCFGGRGGPTTLHMSNYVLAVLSAGLGLTQEFS